MRIVMPLFSYHTSLHELFHFSDGRLSIQPIEDAARLCSGEIFSVRDRFYIMQETYALIADAGDLKGYEDDASLLLSVFRIFSDRITPLIKYRLSFDENFTRRLEGTQTINHQPGDLYEVYAKASLREIDHVYLILRQSERRSVRLKNALFFLYRAFHSPLDRFISISHERS
jgi:hypothetical protein